MNPSNVIVWPVARRPYVVSDEARASTSTPTWSNLASAIRVGIERGRDALGRTHPARGSHRLVRLLRVPTAGLVPSELADHVPVAVLALDELGGLGGGRR